jgi:hypothetical protein
MVLKRFIFHVPVVHALGHSGLPHVESVQPRRTMETRLAVRHRPWVRHTSDSRQQCETSAIGLQGVSPLALLPSG